MKENIRRWWWWWWRKRGRHITHLVVSMWKRRRCYVFPSFSLSPSLSYSISIFLIDLMDSTYVDFLCFHNRERSSRFNLQHETAFSIFPHTHTERSSYGFRLKINLVCSSCSFLDTHTRVVIAAMTHSANYTDTFFLSSSWKEKKKEIKRNRVIMDIRYTFPLIEHLWESFNSSVPPSKESFYKEKQKLVEMF